METKTLSQFRLEKDGENGKRVAILQGMRHVAPARWFELLQGEIDQLTGEGYVVFYEGVFDSPEIPLPTKNAQRLARLYDHWSGKLMRRSAKKMQQIYQDKALNYPPNAVNADMAFQEIANLLDQRGLRWPWIADRLYTIIWRYRNRDWKSLSLWRKTLILFYKLAVVWRRWISKKARPITTERRNEVAFAIAKEKESDKQYFPYGEDHIPGLVRLFLKDGWEVRGVLFRDPDRI